jgi:hypothetical protein
MKKLFTNYNFEFDKNEKKMILTFIKQVLKQTDGDNRYFAENKAFTSIQAKLQSGETPVKLTKDERTRLKHQLEQNVKFYKKEIDKAGFLKKFLYKSALKQYETILKTHFSEK